LPCSPRRCLLRDMKKPLTGRGGRAISPAGVRDQRGWQRSSDREILKVCMSAF
jgi:hypothetical protein